MKLYQINKNLFMFIPSGTAMLNANVYIIKDNINAIIDTGTSTTLGKNLFLRILKSLRIKKIDKIIITHTHQDHYSNAGFFQELFNCEILAHPSGIPILLRGNKGIDIKDFEYLEFFETAFPIINKKRINRAPIKNFITFGYKLYLGKVKQVKKVKILNDNDTISFGNLEMKILHTPGHSHDSICIYELKSKILFTGDTVPFTPYLGTSITDIINSIQKLINYKHQIRFVFRGHGYRTHPWCEELPLYLTFLDSIKRAEKRILLGLKLKGPMKLHKIVPLMYERTHQGHQRFYKLMRTDNMWALKYLQDLEEKKLIKKDENQKYYLI